MEPQPQLQPIAPRPQLDYAEPTARPLELKPGPRPLDLRPRPSARPQLDLKYGPLSPDEAIRQRTSPLSNPLNVVKPVINNPLGYAPGKGLAAAAAALGGRAFDPATFTPPVEEFYPAPAIALPLPSELPTYFDPEASDSGPVLVPEIPAPFAGGQLAIQYRIVWNEVYPGINWPQQHDYLVGPISYVTTTGPADLNEACGQNAPYRTFGLRTEGARLGLASGCAASVTGLTVTPRFPVADPGPNPAPLQAGQRAPNAARKPGVLPAPLPAPTTDRPGAPFKTAPVPTLVAPDLRNPELPQVEPLNPPELDPDRPLLDPRQPFKFPPVPSVPSFPSDDPTVPESPTKRPPPVQFPPVKPGITGPELVPIKPPVIPIIVIPPLRDNGCLTGDEFRRADGFLRKLIEEILDRLLNDCKDLCGDAQLTRSFCEEVNGELVPRQEFLTYTTLGPALGFLSREIAALKAIADPCTADTLESVGPILLSSGTSAEGTTVFYVDILPTVRQVELIITGQIPSTIRLYDTTFAGEQQGKFGAITLAYPGVAGGNAPDAFHQWAWTRRTSFYVGEPIRNDRRIRIQLKPLLSWILYDTGLRS